MILSFCATDIPNTKSGILSNHKKNPKRHFTIKQIKKRMNLQRIMNKIYIYQDSPLLWVVTHMSFNQMKNIWRILLLPQEFINNHLQLKNSLPAINKHSMITDVGEPYGYLKRFLLISEWMIGCGSVKWTKVWFFQDEINKLDIYSHNVQIEMQIGWEITLLRLT